MFTTEGAATFVCNGASGVPGASVIGMSLDAGDATARTGVASSSLVVESRRTRATARPRLDRRPWPRRTEGPSGSTRHGWSDGATRRDGSAGSSGCG